MYYNAIVKQDKNTDNTRYIRECDFNYNILNNIDGNSHVSRGLLNPMNVSPRVTSI